MPTAPKLRKDDDSSTIAWTTVTYRSVLLSILAILAIIGVAVYLMFPEQSTRTATKAFTWITEKLAGSNKNTPVIPAGAQQAKFTALDGTIRVKKASSNTWVNADFNLMLEKGDVVQTGSEGIAKIRFADGTDYTVKPDSLIVVEENTMNAQQQTQVAVQVTTGTVDLATANYTPGSTSEVRVAGASAKLAPESAAMVSRDARTDNNEILVKQGSGEVVRGNQTVRISDYDKVSFKSDSPTMAKVKELRPPTLIAPSNMLPIFSAGKEQQIAFSWTPIDSVSTYRIRISQNPYFSSTVIDRKTIVPELRVNGLNEGAYYWVVQAVDARGKESIESEKNRFTIIPKGKSDVQLALEIEPFIQHGRLIEVRGKTEPGARVMVNGQEVAVVRGDGSFSHFTGQLPDGENVITVTAQNAKGGVATQQKKIVMSR